jgi:glycine cleavage system H protein
LSNNPEDLRYTRSHEWVRLLEGKQVEIGVTDHAQGTLGDLVFVELPPVGRRVTAGEPCAVVESVKAASDVYSPVSGNVVAANAALVDKPELLNQEPYGKGWLIRIERDEPTDDTLLTAAEYEKFLTEQTH